MHNSSKNGMTLIAAILMLTLSLSVFIGTARYVLEKMEIANQVSFAHQMQSIVDGLESRIAVDGNLINKFPSAIPSSTNVYFYDKFKDIRGLLNGVSSTECLPGGTWVPSNNELDVNNYFKDVSLGLCQREVLSYESDVRLTIRVKKINGTERILGLDFSVYNIQDFPESGFVFLMEEMNDALDAKSNLQRSSRKISYIDTSSPISSSTGSYPETTFDFCLNNNDKCGFKISTDFLLADKSIYLMVNEENALKDVSYYDPTSGIDVAVVCTDATAQNVIDNYFKPKFGSCPISLELDIVKDIMSKVDPSKLDEVLDEYFAQHPMTKCYNKHGIPCTPVDGKFGVTFEIPETGAKHSCTPLMLDQATGDELSAAHLNICRISYGEINLPNVEAAFNDITARYLESSVLKIYDFDDGEASQSPGEIRFSPSLAVSPSDVSCSVASYASKTEKDLSRFMTLDKGCRIQAVSDNDPSKETLDVVMYATQGKDVEIKNLTTNYLYANAVKAERLHIATNFSVGGVYKASQIISPKVGEALNCDELLRPQLCKDVQSYSNGWDGWRKAHKSEDYTNRIAELGTAYFNNPNDAAINSSRMGHIMIDLDFVKNPSTDKWEAVSPVPIVTEYEELDDGTSLEVVSTEYVKDTRAQTVSNYFKYRILSCERTRQMLVDTVGFNTPDADSHSHHVKPAGVSFKCGLKSKDMTKPATYFWYKDDEFETCDNAQTRKQCGAYTLTNEVWCVSPDAQIVADSFCIKSLGAKPSGVISCPDTCTYDWVSAPYGSCSTDKTCGMGDQKVRVKCVSTPLNIEVPDGYCTKPKPATTQACMSKKGPCVTYSWKVGAWSKCSAGACATGTQTRQVWCQGSDGKKYKDRFCKSSRPVSTQVCSGPMYKDSSSKYSPVLSADAKDPMGGAIFNKYMNDFDRYPDVGGYSFWLNAYTSGIKPINQLLKDMDSNWLSNECSGYSFSQAPACYKANSCGGVGEARFKQNPPVCREYCP